MKSDGSVGKRKKKGPAAEERAGGPGWVKNEEEKEKQVKENGKGFFGRSEIEIKS